MKKQLLLILMTLLPMVSWADESGKCGDNLTWTYYESTHSLVIAGSGDMNNYDYYNSAPWYKYSNDILSVTLSEGLMSIGNYAFMSCTSLTSVTIPNSVTAIGDEAFYGCSGLTSVTIPNSVTSIGYYAFEGCSSLTSIDIPNSVTSIGNSAFTDCSGLTSVNIGKSVASIGENAFYNCSGLTAVYISDLEAWCKIDFHNNPLLYAHHLYLNGAEIKDLVIPNSVTAISNGAFSGCNGLTSVDIPNSVTSIGSSAFYNCI